MLLSNILSSALYDWLTVLIRDIFNIIIDVHLIQLVDLLDKVAIFCLHMSPALFGVKNNVIDKISQ